MSDENVDIAVRQAIGGDESSNSWILAHAGTSGDAVLIAMAALLERNAERLTRADVVATTSRAEMKG